MEVKGAIGVPDAVVEPFEPVMFSLDHLAVGYPLEVNVLTYLT